MVHFIVHRKPSAHQGFLYFEPLNHYIYKKKNIIININQYICIYIIINIYIYLIGCLKKDGFAVRFKPSVYQGLKEGIFYGFCKNEKT